MKASVFREYDVRGLTGTELTEADYHLLGRAFGTDLAAHHAVTVVVGRDVRPSSDGFARELRRGLVESGRRVLDLGVVTTPMTVFGLNFLGAHASAMVTASHNPAEYNGLKLRRKRPVFGRELQALRELLEAGRFASGSGLEEAFDVREAYLTAVVGRVRPNRAFKVVVDAGNGCGGLVAPDLLDRLGFTVVPLYCDPDGSFPNHHPDPTVPANLEDLRERVVAEGADAGVAFDGDADRVALVDETGAIHWPDRLLMALARHELPRHGGGAVVFDVKCSQGVSEVVRALGGEPVMVKTGYPFILQGMRDHDAVLGAELSGHVYFGRDALFDFDDGVHAACRVLEAFSRDRRPISEQMADLPRSVSTPEIRLEVPEERKFAIVEELLRRLRQDGEVTELIDIDGARAVYPEGWGLVRASNTQPSLVLVFESSDEAGLARVKHRFAKLLGALADVDVDLSRLDLG